MNQPVRKPLFGGLDDTASHLPARKPVDRAHIDAISKEQGFPSRQPPKSQSLATEDATQKASEVAHRTSSTFVTRHRRRFRTGRNAQLNLKVLPTVIDQMNALADELNVPLGEVL